MSQDEGRERATRETNPAILSGQLRFMARTLDGERRACVIDAADALDRLRTPTAEPSEPVGWETVFVGPQGQQIKRLDTHPSLPTPGQLISRKALVYATPEGTEPVGLYAHPVPEDSESAEVERLLRISAPDSYVEKYGREAAEHFMSGVNACIRILNRETDG